MCDQKLTWSRFNLAQDKDDEKNENRNTTEQFRVRETSPMSGEQWRGPLGGWGAWRQSESDGWRAVIIGYVVLKFAVR